VTAEDLVKNVILEVLCESEFTNESLLKEDLNADSLDKVQMVVEFEAALGIEIPDQEIDKLSTVGDVVALVKRYDQSKL
jgi:acyl carrier protein